MPRCRRQGGTPRRDAGFVEQGSGHAGLDMVAECLESGGGRPNGVGNVGIDLGVRADGVIEEPDTKPAGIPPDEIGVGLVLTRCDDAITGNVHDGGVEDRRRVSHRVTHDVLDRVAPLVHVRAHRDAAGSA